MGAKYLLLAVLPLLLDSVLGKSEPNSSRDTNLDPLRCVLLAELTFTLRCTIFYASWR